MFTSSSLLLSQRYFVSQSVATRLGKKFYGRSAIVPRSCSRPLCQQSTSRQRFIVAAIQQRSYGSAGIASSTLPGALSKQQAKDLAIRLTSDERDVLISSLQECQSHKVKAEYEGQLAAFRWRSKFGRPSTVPSLGDVDPTGSYCAVPDDWLLRKYAETVPQPKKSDLMRLSVANAIPYIGFGFLDNFIMIIAGEGIEAFLGAMITLTTMAAAALGNTISDICGIGLALYVERCAQTFGIKPANLTPIQLGMRRSQFAANVGRIIGVVIGCLLGMTPLLFMGKETKKEDAPNNSNLPSTETQNLSQESVVIAK